MAPPTGLTTYLLLTPSIYLQVCCQSHVTLTNSHANNRAEIDCKSVLPLGLPLARQAGELGTRVTKLTTCAHF